jgi:hypothetical protein
VVSRLAQNLNTCGVDVWFDAWELRVGDDLHQRIADAIAKSKFVAVVVSGRFDSSKWTKGGEGRRSLVGSAAINRRCSPSACSREQEVLEFTGDHYFESLVRLVGLIHGLDSEAVESGLSGTKPRSMRVCIEVPRFTGFEPYLIVDTKTLVAIKDAGGSGSGDKVRFDPREIMTNPNASPALRQLMARLIDDWGSD